MDDRLALRRISLYHIRNNYNIYWAKRKNEVKSKETMRAMTAVCLVKACSFWVAPLFPLWISCDYDTGQRQSIRASIGHDSIQQSSSLGTHYDNQSILYGKDNHFKKQTIKPVGQRRWLGQKKKRSASFSPEIKTQPSLFILFSRCSLWQPALRGLSPLF